jgi:hypothetical protein
MASPARPTVKADFNEFVLNNLSFDTAKKIYDAAVLFVESVMADEFRKRVKSQKAVMASGGLPDYIPDVDMEKRLSGVLRFADVLAQVFTSPVAEMPKENTDNVDSAYKKRKKTVGK